MKYLKCSYCKETKPETEFSVSKSIVRRGGRSYACFPCGRENYQRVRRKNPEIQKRSNAKRRAEYVPEKQRDASRKSRYGISPEKYTIMLESQEGKCKICGLESEDNTYGKLYIDHDHDTGEIRGLLCHSCNMGIAHVKDAKWLIEAAKYLNLTREE